MSDERFFVDQHGFGTTLCPGCAAKQVLTLGPTEPGGVHQETCTECGIDYEVVAERRYFLRCEARVRGIYWCGDGPELPMRVEDVSIAGLRFRVDQGHGLRRGARVWVAYVLDGKEHKHEVQLKSVKGVEVGAVFLRS